MSEKKCCDGGAEKAFDEAKDDCQRNAQRRRPWECNEQAGADDEPGGEAREFAKNRKQKGGEKRNQGDAERRDEKREGQVGEKAETRIKVVTRPRRP